MALLKNIFFKSADKIQTFAITRLHMDNIGEQVFLEQDKQRFNITRQQGMVCLDPFCMIVWLPREQADLVNPKIANIRFLRGTTLNALIRATLTEKQETDNGALLLFKIENARNYQFSVLHRLVYFGYFIRSKTNTFYSRRVISALYSYPRSIIIVSYKDDGYYNIFPMDIHCYIEAEDIYVLGLRTTNVTLERILTAKKVVVSDTNAVDIDTVYSLGKHSSKAPTPINELPFETVESEVYHFPVPDFAGSYKEIEIISNKKLGYHMMMIGKVIHTKKLRKDPTSLYHLGFLQSCKSNYQGIDGLF